MDLALLGPAPAASAIGEAIRAGWGDDGEYEVSLCRRCQDVGGRESRFRHCSGEKAKFRLCHAEAIPMS